jgi:hypothetical protein
VWGSRWMGKGDGLWITITFLSHEAVVRPHTTSKIVYDARKNAKKEKKTETRFVVGERNKENKFHFTIKPKKE